jgi:hypothetical protein
MDRSRVSVDCTPAVLQPITKLLEEFGCRVEFETPLRGKVIHLSGVLRFSHNGRRMHVTVERDYGHFPRLLLLGGIRQLIEEAAEISGETEAPQPHRRPATKSPPAATTA